MVVTQAGQRPGKGTNVLLCKYQVLAEGVCFEVKSRAEQRRVRAT